MFWFFKIGICIIILSLTLELVYCLAKPINYTDKMRKIEDIWHCIFGCSISGGIISCIIYVCGLIITTPSPI